MHSIPPCKIIKANAASRFYQHNSDIMQKKLGAWQSIFIICAPTNTEGWESKGNHNKIIQNSTIKKNKLTHHPSTITQLHI